VNRKMMRIFLIGVLFGVMIMAAVTVVFAIPANDFHWRMEIWNRGGAAWCVDRNGHLNWKWMTDWLGVPKAVPSRQKRVTAPVNEVSLHTEQL
jgi:hypothetical protein